MYNRGEPPPFVDNYNRGYHKNYQHPYHKSRRVLYDEYDEPDNCTNFSKYAIYGANILFILVGMATLTLGVWLRVDSRFRDFLSERYRQAVDEAFWEAPTLYTFSYILIIMGSFMIIAGIMGCCGVGAGGTLSLLFYVILLFVLLVCTVSSIIYILYKKDGIDVELSDALNYMVQHYYQGAGVVQESLDRLQQAFRCCGNAGCSDFRAFRQDPPRTCDIRCDGCHYRIWLALRIGFSVAIVIFLIVILAQLISIGVAIGMMLRDKKKTIPYGYPYQYYPQQIPEKYRAKSLRPPVSAVSYKTNQTRRTEHTPPRPVPKLRLK
ncbi:unnamed protein product [Bursaphelenchus xylophilus]|uniref:(pine wood nematode) hypothetical protein n=1 Tax=Bursaphelenchus xylophilus TaxID=6326 RepID=A0A1I7SU30_BURXY|nr:unnamed protein product [Bursaphelenchus xylophilus]CAG9107638.1 unnamed protein product [Bursaphelenchus xylophilus]